MSKYLLKNATIINEGETIQADLLIQGERIEKIAANISDPTAEVIDLEGKWLMPGMIDDQVHFREPGLTHKGEIYTESRAAVAGGITSFMEMPNTVPNALTQELLEDKYQIANRNSLANYSFFMGASNDNIEEVLKTNHQNVCGVKVFMGSSTGNMLVDNEQTLTNIFSKCDMLIATHCEDEATIRKNLAIYKAKYGEDMPIKYHPEIRSAEACYLSSSLAVNLAKKYQTRLHVLHLSTAIEMDLFDNTIDLKDKKITAEACVHHLWFTDEDYDKKGTLIKWNPAVKSAKDRAAIWEGLRTNKIDIIATDHAPHTLVEKDNNYFKAPSGGPLVQHAVLAILEKVKEGNMSLTQAIEKMSHAPAICFQVKERGFIREGYFADLVVVDPKKSLTVTKENLLYKCGWSPFEGVTFSHSIAKTFVNGALVYDKDAIIESPTGQRLSFDRP
ncbi:dihydroorotase [Putridiphycobacter roseus]|uniref:Dihydroorotase n=1 Tax=Putridiphycobacter roseus TaxID=2219161 RepID=A0A2W1NTF7_9FLAO|nr:dihydroorotase [Putridiphycobacter roseus]PZE17998.1 dihydroorotase [Putridiphycobacter roseus]